MSSRWTWESWIWVSFLSRSITATNRHCRPTTTQHVRCRVSQHTEISLGRNPISQDGGFSSKKMVCLLFGFDFGRNDGRISSSLPTPEVYLAKEGMWGTLQREGCIQDIGLGPIHSSQCAFVRILFRNCASSVSNMVLCGESLARYLSDVGSRVILTSRNELERFSSLLCAGAILKHGRW